jgi:uncharacterized protein YegP (UPF0339 family)
MYARFEIYLGNDHQYYFRFISPSGINLGYSEGYTTKGHAEHGIVSVKQNAKNIHNFTVFPGTDGFYYFHLKAQNHEIILRSSHKYHTSDVAVQAAIEVSTYAPNAYVSDLTQTTASRF